MFYLKMHMNVVCVCTCICVHSLHGQNKEFCSVLFCSSIVKNFFGKPSVYGKPLVYTQSYTSYRHMSVMVVPGRSWSVAIFIRPIQRGSEINCTYLTPASVCLE